jgi:hypothetical protein
MPTRALQLAAFIGVVLSLHAGPRTERRQQAPDPLATLIAAIPRVAGDSTGVGAGEQKLAEGGDVVLTPDGDLKMMRQEK